MSVYRKLCGLSALNNTMREISDDILMFHDVCQSYSLRTVLCAGSLRSKKTVVVEEKHIRNKSKTMFHYR